MGPPYSTDNSWLGSGLFQISTRPSSCIQFASPWLNLGLLLFSFWPPPWSPPDIPLICCSNCARYAPPNNRLGVCLARTSLRVACCSQSFLAWSHTERKWEKLQRPYLPATLLPGALNNNYTLAVAPLLHYDNCILILLWYLRIFFCSCISYLIRSQYLTLFVRLCIYCLR